MATVDEHVKDILGHLLMQNAMLRAELDTANERARHLEAELAREREPARDGAPR
jgi:hypothetical protein